MRAKLTLTVDKSVIDKAKRFGKKQGTSLSDLIENYLKIITNEEVNNDIEFTPTVKSISGSFKLPANFDYKKALTETLSHKYLKCARSS